MNPIVLHLSYLFVLVMVFVITWIIANKYQWRRKFWDWKAHMDETNGWKDLRNYLREHWWLWIICGVTIIGAILWNIFMPSDKDRIKALEVKVAKMEIYQVEYAKKHVALSQDHEKTKAQIVILNRTAGIGSARKSLDNPGERKTTLGIKKWRVILMDSSGNKEYETTCSSSGGGDGPAAKNLNPVHVIFPNIIDSDTNKPWQCNFHGLLVEVAE